MDKEDHYRADFNLMDREAFYGGLCFYSIEPFEELGFNKSPFEARGTPSPGFNYNYAFLTL